MSSVLSVRNHRFTKLESAPAANGRSRFDTSTLAPAEKATEKSVLFLGFDWGTNKSCLKAGYAGKPETAIDQIVPTVVGYAKEGIVDGLLPDNATVLFGKQALQHRLHLNLVQPMVDGVVKDLASARDFAKHLRSLINVEEGTEIRAVIGVPANADSTARENVRQGVSGLFERVLLVPEPFLAALGFRDETRLSGENYVDPVRNSLFVDIGGGTTDVCLVQGYYPTADDQISLAFAGDKVDALFYDAVRKTYPDCELSTIKVRELKEQHSFVGQAAAPVIVSVMVNGKIRKLDITEQLGNACTELLNVIFNTVKELIARTSSDSVGELLQNIIITGGGSRIRGLDTELQRLLAEEGYEQPCVRLAGERYKEFVALGALKAARGARDNQWQQVIK
ncbi:MAG TPA: rod shape-determining protein [Candidatus Limnocylindria bacterium]|nr:rod shape-determining protein [Candidatus Limnocylindria bacterium]